MPYTRESKLSAFLEHERDLLTAGFSYSDIASRTGAKLGTVKERNRLIYGVDLRAAFRARVDREGIPNRYVRDDAFGWWFTGYFDGEGCLSVFDRIHNGRPERRVGIQIACRDDDADVLAYVHKTLGIGVVWKTGAKGTTRPASNWRVERAADLAEVMLPIFDNYPLRTKKRSEYAIWRGLVVNQYVNTLGSTATRVGASEEEHAAFQSARQAIRNIRHGAGA